MLAYLANILINIISQTGYFGIFSLMTIESLLVPLPSEITMPFSGFLVSTGKLTLVGVALAGGLGNLFGSILAYALGYWGEEVFVLKFIKKYGKYLLISEHEYEKSRRWFEKYGQFIVFVSRLLPGIRTYISLPAGVAKMNFKKFCFFTFLGSLIWSFILALIGVKLGENWETIGAYFHRLDAVIGISLTAMILLFIYKKTRKKNTPV